MSTTVDNVTPSATTDATDAQDGLQKIEQTAGVILQSLGTKLTSMTVELRRLAVEVIIPARRMFTVEKPRIKADGTVAKTKDGVTIRDTMPTWNGRSQEYREWFGTTFRSLVSEHIPGEYLHRDAAANAGKGDHSGPFYMALQNAVQNAVKDAATPQHLRNLGMIATKKAAKKDDPKPSESTRTNPADTPSTTNWIADDEILKGAPEKDAEGKTTGRALSVLDLTLHVANAASILGDRTKNGARLPQGQLDQFNTLAKQALRNLNTAMANQAANQKRSNTTDES